jgi:hypothetical protein
MTTQWLRSPCADDANAEESGAPSCDRRHLVGLQEGHHLLRVRPETSGGQVTEEDVQHGAEQRSGPDHAAQSCNHNHTTIMKIKVREKWESE